MKHYMYDPKTDVFKAYLVTSRDAAGKLNNGSTFADLAREGAGHNIPFLLQWNETDSYTVWIYGKNGIVVSVPDAQENIPKGYSRTLTEQQYAAVKVAFPMGDGDVYKCPHCDLWHISAEALTPEDLDRLGLPNPFARPRYKKRKPR